MKGKTSVVIPGLLSVLGFASSPLKATVTIASMTPSVASPQPLGTAVTWTVTATNTNPNNLMFQFNVASGKQPFQLAADFNVGTQSTDVWTAPTFTWSTIAGEGSYTIEVIAKDFVSGETSTKKTAFTLKSRTSKGPNVVTTSNPLVALFSNPACPAGSNFQVAYYSGSNLPAFTGWQPCNPSLSSNVYVAGMYPSTTYTMYAQIQTGNNVTDGPDLTFTTKALKELNAPNVLPHFSVTTAAGPDTDTTDGLVFWTFAGTAVPTATDLAGKVVWYYGNGSGTLVTRVLPGGTILTFQNGRAWNSSDQELQLLKEIDFAGNTVRETNVGILAYGLAAIGAPVSAPCPTAPNPPVGTTCLNDLDHEAIRYSINGQEYTAVLAHAESIYPAGTQGSNPAGPPVDILSEFLIVLNSQFQPVWYYTSYQQLSINRAAVLGEVCVSGTTCQVNLILDTSANDWTHANTIYYIAAEGNLLLSIRDQDWVVKLDYNNGTGTGKILWTMGPGGDFTLNNIGNDPWPWFSHQHDSVFQNAGAGPMTVFDNGNTRVSAAPLGLGSNCGPSDCHSRGMALTVDEAGFQVTPDISVDLGVYASTEGSAELLFDGNYFFQPGQPDALGIEMQPTPGTVTGTEVLRLGSTYSSYRAWQMSSLYNPPLS